MKGSFGRNSEREERTEPMLEGVIDVQTEPVLDVAELLEKADHAQEPTLVSVTTDEELVIQIDENSGSVEAPASEVALTKEGQAAPDFEPSLTTAVPPPVQAVERSLEPTLKSDLEPKLEHHLKPSSTPNPERSIETEPQLADLAKSDDQILAEEQEQPKQRRRGLIEYLLELTLLQKILLALGFLVAFLGCGVVYRVPAEVMAELFNFGDRAPIRMMEILQWNSVLVVLPMLITLWTFFQYRSSRYIGRATLVAAVIASALLLGVSAVFSYFVLAVAA